jgi:cob(I)alamin adenosyltransferase
MPVLYTRSGDDGFTCILGEGRLPKNHPIPEALGCIDEASAALGVARAICESKENATLILQIQRDLYHLMAEISATPENAPRYRKIDASRISWLETYIDNLTHQIDVPGEFVVPGDSPAGAALALARTIVRRSERRVVALFHDNEFENIELLRYLNRLSSLCFVLELFEDALASKSTPTLAKE